MEKIFNYNSEGHKLFKQYKYRLENVNLIWVNQVVELIQLFKIRTINDLGCNYFQFYKGLKNKYKNKYDYYGYDVEEKFIKLGLSKFPELLNKYKICNIQKDFIRKCDCSIASAIVEHVSKPYNLIKKILNKSNKIFILRTYLGEKDEFIIKNNAKNPYYFHQFSKKKISKVFKSKGFKVIFILDEATDLSKKYKIINKKSKRTRFIILGYKNI